MPDDPTDTPQRRRGNSIGYHEQPSERADGQQPGARVRDATIAASERGALGILTLPPGRPRRWAFELLVERASDEDLAALAGFLRERMPQLFDPPAH